jgi:hypothetical protein
MMHRALRSAVTAKSAVAEGKAAEVPGGPIVPDGVFLVDVIVHALSQGGSRALAPAEMADGVSVSGALGPPAGCLALRFHSAQTLAQVMIRRRAPLCAACLTRPARGRRRLARSPWCSRWRSAITRTTWRPASPRVSRWRRPATPRRRARPSSEPARSLALRDATERLTRRSLVQPAARGHGHCRAHAKPTAGDAVPDSFAPVRHEV